MTRNRYIAAVQPKTLGIRGLSERQLKSLVAMYKDEFNYPTPVILERFKVSLDSVNRYIDSQCIPRRGKYAKER